ncbi:MAG: hypothetical protein DRP45_06755 [Candidatus Zixiibacteriota bacterium]|nr:MAG: hypothetical protein DRP45_06755 [candidate division Zixibacteria bacterium]
MRALVWFCSVGLVLLSISGCGRDEGNGKTSNAAEPDFSLHYRSVPTYTPEQFCSLGSFKDLCMATSDKLAYVSGDPFGDMCVCRIVTDGGPIKPFAFSREEPVWMVTSIPTEDEIICQRDRGFDAPRHLSVPLSGGQGKFDDLIPWPDAHAEFYSWSWDEKSFFFGCNHQDHERMDVYEAHVEDRIEHGVDIELFYQNDSGYVFGDISNDKRHIAFCKSNSNYDSDILLYDLESGQMSNITRHNGDVICIPQCFSADAQGLYYLTDENSEYRYLKHYDIETESTEIFEKYDHDIMSMYFSEAGKYMVVVSNEDGFLQSLLFDVAKREEVLLPEITGASIVSSSFSLRETLMGMIVTGPRFSSTPYMYDINAYEYWPAEEGRHTDIEPSDLVDPQRLRFESFDGLEIPALLYTPHQLRPGSSAPALIRVGDGPGGQLRLEFDALTQLLVNHGYVVLAVNPRGSSGYGKTFSTLDDGRHGVDDLADCVAAKRLLAATGYVDTSKIGIIGEGYGGFLATRALAFQPDEFVLGVDMFGPVDFEASIRNMPAWRQAERDELCWELGDPETDRDYLNSISPVSWSEKIAGPLLVLYSERDKWNNKHSVEKFLEEAKDNGVGVQEFLVQNDDNRLLNKETRIAAYERVLLFLEEHLGVVVSPEPVDAGTTESGG